MNIVNDNCEIINECKKNWDSKGISYKLKLIDRIKNQIVYEITKQYNTENIIFQF